MDQVGVRRLVRRMQDVLRTDAGVDGDAQRLAQIAWMLHFKASSLGQIDSAHGKGDGLSWAHYRDRFSLDRQGAVEFTNLELLPALRAASSFSGAACVADDFKNYVTSDEVLGELIDLLDRLPLKSSSDRHLIGDVYETLLASLRNAKHSGEFYTPRALTRFMAEVIAPTAGSVVMDPASGTGGFLVSALEYVRDTQGVSAANSLTLHAREKKSLPHLLCATNLLLHDYTDHSTILRTNPLAGYGASHSDSDQFDFILANPPFGGEEEPGVESNFPLEYKSRDTSLLFVLYIVSALKPGGRAAIILPDGFMFQTGVCARVRRHLLTACNVEAVVRLPKGAFAPYTGIETNILFFTKGEKTQSVAFYEHRYPDGVKTYSKTRPIEFSELRPLIRYIKGDCAPTADSSMRVSIARIEQQDWSLNFRSDSKAVAPSLSVVTQAMGRVSAVRAEEVHKLQGIISANEIEAIDAGRFAELLPTLATSTKGISALERGLLTLAFNREIAFEGSKSGPSARRLEGWSQYQLSDIGRIVGGSTPPSDDPDNFAEDGIPWLTPADLRGLKGKYAEKGRRSLSRAGFHSCSVELMPQGTVLFSSRAPIGYVAIAANELCTNQGFKSFVPSDLAWSDYFYYHLKYLAPEIDRQAPGTTFKEVSGAVMKKVEVALPPVKERDAIVAWLDAAFDQVQRLREAVTEETQLHETLCDVLAA